MLNPAPEIGSRLSHYWIWHHFPMLGESHDWANRDPNKIPMKQDWF